MSLRKRFLFAYFLMMLTCISIIPVTVLQAQDAVVLSVALPEFARNFLGEDTFAPFEAENPGIKVNVVYTGFDALFVTPAASDVDAHLEAVQENVSRADVLLVDSSSLSVEGTRAGLFLDLSPLTNADSSLNVDDFIPAAWQSFQWDSGVWGLPVLTDIISVIYNPEAFDQAGLRYPNEAWSIDDFANAARLLAEYDTSGNVTSPGLVTFNNTSYLLRALLGQGFYDNNTIPESPAFDDEKLEILLTAWAELESEGVFSRSFSGDISDAPLRIFSAAEPGNFRIGSDDEPISAFSLLPGGVAGLDITGFAVSSGTQYPEMAFALANYLTNNVEIANSPLGIAPVRRSLVGVQPSDGGNGNGGQFFAQRILSSESQALIDQGLANSLPASELRYADYVLSALNSVVDDGIDVHSALQQAESDAISNLQSASDRRTTTTVFVATPVPEVVLQPGEISLNFGMLSFIQPVPNLQEWNQLIAEFVANDPQVGQVNLDTGARQPADYANQYDCFYLPYNAVPSLDTTTLLNLDPFMDVDPSFDRNDVVGHALSLIQKENKTWALPVAILPEVLRYHTDLFIQSNVPLPENGWTIDQFSDALHQLKPTVDDTTPFVPRGAGGSYLLQLIAAYGGLPIDQRTSPPTINFTDPDTVQAVQQVLDLVKDGYIAYQELARAEFSIFINQQQLDPIYTESLNGFSVRQIQTTGSSSDVDPYHITTYPLGQYPTISYDIATAYISAATQNADACYRWISAVARHPQLFSAMPARRSLINDPVFITSQGANTVAIYNQFDTLMSDPNAINFQSPFAGNGNPSDFLVEFWLNRAFDRYVLEDADLSGELAEAESYAVAYLGCVANIAPFDEAVQTRQSYAGQFITCASTVDSSMSGLIAVASPAG